MTAKTRYFFIGAALILVLGLSVGLVAYFGGVPGSLFAAGAGPDELRYVPTDAAVVAYANVKDVMTSDLRQRMVKLDESSVKGGREEFKNETGIDIEKDIDYVVACIGAKGASADDANALLLARGRFDTARIEAMALQHGGKVEQYKGKHVMTGFGDHSRPGAATETSMAMSFVENGLAAMGQADMVRQAIDRAANGGSSVRKNAELMKLVGEMGSPSMWAVGRFDSIAAQAKLSAEVTDRIPPITWFAASGHINGGIQATIKAEAKTAEAAKNLRDIVQGFAALAKMQAGNTPQAQAMWPDIQLGGTDNTVTLSFTVSSALLDMIGSGGTMRHKIDLSGKGEKEIR